MVILEVERVSLRRRAAGRDEATVSFEDGQVERLLSAETAPDAFELLGDVGEV